MIEVPEKVSSKVYQPSVPADNGVNEMRYQVARLYTALNIEVNLPVLSQGTSHPGHGSLIDDFRPINLRRRKNFCAKKKV